jgi:hypothetical protein
MCIVCHIKEIVGALTFIMLFNVTFSELVVHMCSNLACWLVFTKTLEKNIIIQLTSAFKYLICIP